jgi:hypothetical protein
MPGKNSFCFFMFVQGLPAKTNNEFRRGQVTTTRGIGSMRFGHLMLA